MCRRVAGIGCLAILALFAVVIVAGLRGPAGGGSTNPRPSASAKGSSASSWVYRPATGQKVETAMATKAVRRGGRVYFMTGEMPAPGWWWPGGLGVPPSAVRADAPRVVLVNATATPAPSADAHVIIDDVQGPASDKLAMMWTAGTYTAAFCAGILGVLLVGRVFGSR